MYDGKLIGIVSFGTMICSSGNYDVFTRASEYFGNLIFNLIFYLLDSNPVKRLDQLKHVSDFCAIVNNHSNTGSDKNFTFWFSRFY